LEKDVLAGEGGFDGGLGVPVVGGGDGYGVDGGVLQHLAVIAVGFDLGVVVAVFGGVALLDVILGIGLSNGV
jgi:hypothetical protein